MTLADTGPLVALIDTRDANHARCVAAARELPDEPLLITVPCYTEAMYLVGKSGGFPAQRRLWTLRQSGGLVLHLSSEPEFNRMEELMEAYRDVPMDYADASLVAAAEVRGLVRIFTVDGHFYAYRINGTETFQIVP